MSKRSTAETAEQYWRTVVAKDCPQPGCAGDGTYLPPECGYLPCPVCERTAALLQQEVEPLQKELSNISAECSVHDLPPADTVALRVAAALDRLPEQSSSQDRLIEKLRTEVEPLKKEIGAALAVLKPNMPESGLEDACRQVKQAAVSWEGNCEDAEAQIQPLVEALRRLEWIVVDEVYTAHCPVCSVWKDTLHKDDCWLDALLKKHAAALHEN